MKFEGRIGGLVVACLATAAVLVAPIVMASGSAGAGGGVSLYGQSYIAGKVAFHQKIACASASCPIKRADVNKEMASELVASISARDQIRSSTSETDEIVGRLSSAEAEAVKHYLKRRFRI